MKKILFSVIFILLFKTLNAQNPLDTTTQIPRDTTVVGRIIEMDSAVQIFNKSKIGYHYYFGSFHLKIECEGKTIYILRRFNMIEEYGKYLDRFGYRLGEKRIFLLYNSRPCQTEMPRVDGYCDGKYFHPLHGQIIKKYDRIYSVIHDSLWR